MPKIFSMSYNVKTISVFERQAKRLMKKFPSLKKEIQTLIAEIKNEPAKGTPIGHDCYKIRLAVASKGKGKSGGARVIATLFMRITLFIFLPFLTNLKWKTFMIKRLWNL